MIPLCRAVVVVVVEGEEKEEEEDFDRVVMVVVVVVDNDGGNVVSQWIGLLLWREEDGVTKNAWATAPNIVVGSSSSTEDAIIIIFILSVEGVEFGRQSEVVNDGLVHYFFIFDRKVKRGWHPSQLVPANYSWIPTYLLTIWRPITNYSEVSSRHSRVKQTDALISNPILPTSSPLSLVDISNTLFTSIII